MDVADCRNPDDRYRIGHFLAPWTAISSHPGMRSVGDTVAKCVPARHSFCESFQFANRFLGERAIRNGSGAGWFEPEDACLLREITGGARRGWRAVPGWWSIRARKARRDRTSHQRPRHLRAPDDRDSVLGAFDAAGFRTEISFPHWLAKAYGEVGFIDLIYSSGNGVACVDAEWFSHASDGVILGVPVKLCPPEEMIWSKAYVQERERFDGADIAHLIRSRGETLDWRRLLRRFGEHWRVLFSHLVTFGFIYPAERSKIPGWLVKELSERLVNEIEGPLVTDHTCFGTLLSREQYLPDIGIWGYHDARLKPAGPMCPEEVAHWTAAIALSKNC